MKRRELLADAARLVCGVGVAGLALGLHARHAKARPPQAIRPPGAREEAGFLAACVRCGLCVRACPYHILGLAQPEQPVALGTPYFVARSGPCEMCPGIPCVKACPTGALDPKLTEIEKAHMGVAVLADQQNCLNFLGMRCDICHRVCPLIDKAITLDQQRNARTGQHAQFIPVVHAEACTGCGKCESACPLPVAAIKVLPLELARGEPGKHYRLGWVEKDRAGGSLAAPEPKHEYNLPEGMRYELGEGLSKDEAASAPLPGATPAPQGAPRALQGDRL